jgi:hypothetical protein
MIREVRLVFSFIIHPSSLILHPSSFIKSSSLLVRIGSFRKFCQALLKVKAGKVRRDYGSTSVAQPMPRFVVRAALSGRPI